MDAKRRATKNSRKYNSTVDRWQHDEICRASQLVHGWTYEWVKYLDYISKLDISHDAPYRQRLRFNDLNHQHMLLSAFNELKAKEYTRSQCIRGQDKNNTLDPAIQQHLEWLSFNCKTYFSSSSS